MKKINLGCGKDIRQGYVNVDSLKMEGVDKVWDLNRFPWPFKTNEFEEVYTSHFLEHVEDIVRTMKEIHRISKKGARIRIRVPHFSCGVSYRDPTHRRLFSYFTFDYFTDECFYGLPKFRIIKRKINFTRFAMPFLNHVFNPLINLNPEIYERFFCWILPSAEVIAELEAIK